MLHRVTVQMLRQLFCCSGAGDMMCVFERVVDGMYGVEAYVQFRSRWEAARARDALDGQAIYDGCCFLAVDLIPPIYTAITTPSEDKLAPTYFYDDTPYAAWSATLFSAERHEAPACVPGMSLFSASPPPTKAAIKPSASVLSANDPSLMVHTTCSIGCTSGDTSTATSPCTHSSVPASSTSTPNSSADVLTVCVTHEAEDMNLTSLAASPMCLSGDANAAASTVLAAALAAAVPPSSCDAHEMSVAVAEQHGKSAKDDSVVTKDKDA